MGSRGDTRACRGDGAKRGWRLPLLGLVAALYLLTASGRVQTIDTRQTLAVAVSIRTGNGVESASCVHPGGGTIVGRDGRDYSSHDLGMSLLYLPLTFIPGTTAATDPALAGTATPRCSQVSSAKARSTRRLERLASFVPSVVGSLLVLVFALVLVELGFDERTAVVSALLLGVTSIVWVYSHLSFDVTPTACLVLCALYFLIRFARTDGSATALAAGAAVGGAVLLRTDSLFLAVPLSLPVVVSLWRSRTDDLRRSIRTASAWSAPIVAAIVVNLGYNWLRFGSVTNTGHVGDPQTALTHNFAVGLFGQVLSPGKGLIFFSPLVLLALVRWPTFIRRHRVVALTAGTTVAVGLLGHAVFQAWAGDETWGARFTIPVIPLLFIPLAYVIDDIRTRTAERFEGLAVVVLAVLGLAIQLGGVLVDYTALDLPHFYDGTYVGNDLWHPMFLRAFAVLARAPFDAQPYPGFTPSRIAVLQPVRFDLWWVRMGTVVGWDPWSTLVPAVLALLVAWSAVRLTRALRTPTDGRARTPDRDPLVLDP